MPAPVNTTGFVLPVEVSGNNLAPELRSNGLLIKGKITPYTDIKELYGTNDELIIRFHNKKQQELVYEMDKDNAFLLLSVQQIIYKHMRQLNVAKYSPDDEDKTVIINAPVFNFSRVKALKVL